MKKLAVLVAVVSIAALAAPALAATNPFMDVPMNHWAYDAIGQLAAHGILSGYPDGLYKGKQQTTRYEMASALARALAVVDMTKASKQDVEMLKRLVVEFKDELEALGVKVAELDERVAVLEDRLGGWHIHGNLALDVTYQKNKDAADHGDGVSDGKTKFDYDDAKLFVERWWGEDDEYFFRARFNNDDTVSKGLNTKADRFYVEMPFFFDSRLTVGRFNWALEGEYRPKANIGKYETGSFAEGQHLMTDWTWDGFGLTKNFALGTVGAVVAHPNDILGRTDPIKDENNRGYVTAWSDWMIMLYGQFQFTEQFGFDLGGVYFAGDNAETVSGRDATTGLRNGTRVDGDVAFDKMWEIYAALRFNFNENVALKGIFYHQKWEGEYVNNGRWTNYYAKDDGNHWAVMVDVKQEALKYTSLWLEYGQFDEGFVTRGSKGIDTSGVIFDGYAPEKIKYWRIAAGQEWNDKWSTHLFYYGYKVDNANDWKPAEMGLGVQYKLNDYTTMGLNYVHVKDAKANGNDYDKDNLIRFRTSISF